jgi:hypothetical protein
MESHTCDAGALLNMGTSWKKLDICCWGDNSDPALSVGDSLLSGAFLLFLFQWRKKDRSEMRKLLTVLLALLPQLCDCEDTRWGPHSTLTSPQENLLRLTSHRANFQPAIRSTH